MTSDDRGECRILGRLGSADGKGVVRVEDRFDTDIGDLWSALTDPARLVHWLGDVEGDLRPGGAFRARFVASGWEGTGRIEVCDPPRRVLTQMKHTSHVEEQPIEVTLTPSGSQTNLTWEERGMPVELVAAYGAGIQIHVEDLADYLAGRARRDSEARWNALEPLYRDLPVDVQ